MAKKPVRGICFFGGYDEGYPRSDVLRKGLGRLGVPVRVCRVPHKWKVIRRYTGLLAGYLRMERDFDVLFVPEFRHKDVPLAWLLSRLGGKVCVFDPLVSRYDTRVKDRGDARDHSLQSRHNRNLDRVAMRLADVVIADTKAHAEYYDREFVRGKRPIEVVPVGYDDSLFVSRGPDNDAAERVTVLFYGSYLPLHGVETIVRAAHRLGGERHIHFELVGGGQVFGDVERFVAQHDLDNVELIGWLPTAELIERIALANICLGIFGETEKASRVVPNKVFQCMGMERAVITARSPATLEWFQDGVDVSLVPPGDDESLAGAVRTLAGDGQKRRRIASNGYETVSARFRAEGVAAVLRNVCEEAWGARGGGDG